MATVSIPIYCPTCKAFYEPNIFGLVEGAKLEIQNVSSSCPKGHMAHFLDGAYTVKDRLVHLASNSPSTLTAIHEIAQNAVDGRIDADQAADEIIAMDPALAPALSGVGSNRLAILALLAYLVVELSKIGIGAIQSRQPPRAPTVIINNLPSANQDNKSSYSKSLQDNSDYKANVSKRKMRRIRGKAKEDARRKR